MGVYGKAIITNAGRNLIAQALAGNESVRFTELKTSDYQYASGANIEALTDIPNVKQTTDITSVLVTANANVKVSAMVRNSGVTSAYYINTIGIYGNTPGFPDTLIAVIRAVTGDLVPAYSGEPYSFVFDVNLIIQNASNLNVSVNDAGVATVADLEHFYEKVYDVYVSDTASGTVASFEDGANKIPMESVNVNMSPIQSFNGYDRPWGPGMGKNKLLLDGTSKTESGITFTFDNNAGTITINGTATSEVTAFSFFELSAGDYTYTSGITETYTTIDTYISSGSVTIARGNNNAPGPNFSYSGGRTAITVRIREGFVANNLVIKPMVRLQTVTDATFEPYSNICPISGWNAVKVTRAGKNLFDPASSGNEWVTRANIIGNEGASKSVRIPVREGDTITLSNETPSSSTNILLIAFLDNEDTVLSRNVVSSGEKSITDTAPSGSVCAIASFYRWQQVTNAQLEYGTATAYEPYQGQTYSVTFPTEAGTVYGGTLDLVSGSLTITEATITSYAGEALPGEWLSSYDKYAEGATPTTGAQVVYKLATPQTAQLEPLQIDSLYGYNNLWSDAGDVDVKYRADTTLYINKKIAEMQALILENS